MFFSWFFCCETKHDSVFLPGGRTRVQSLGLYTAHCTSSLVNKIKQLLVHRSNQDSCRRVKLPVVRSCLEEYSRGSQTGGLKLCGEARPVQLSGERSAPTQTPACRVHTTTSRGNICSTDRPVMPTAIQLTPTFAYSAEFYHFDHKTLNNLFVLHTPLSPQIPSQAFNDNYYSIPGR